VGPECGQSRFAAPAAGYLAFAGIPMGPPVREEDGRIRVTVDPEHRDVVVTALNFAGANITLVD
jgi:hypothetical protein